MKTSVDNKEAVRRHLDLSWNKREIAGLDEVWAIDAILHLPGGTVIRGSASIKQYLDASVGAYSGRKLVIEEIIGDGETVATRWTFTGVHVGQTLGVEPTNNRVTITGMDFYHMHEGKIIEEWIEIDLMGLMRQLGAA